MAIAVKAPILVSFEIFIVLVLNSKIINKPFRQLDSYGLPGFNSKRIAALFLRSAASLTS